MASPVIEEMPMAQGKVRWLMRCGAGRPNRALHEGLSRKAPPRRARHAAFRGFDNRGHDLAAKPFAKFLGDRQGFKTPLAVQVPCIDGIESQAETTLRH